MKTVYRCLNIFLILHLLAAFSQAAFIAEANCSHCMKLAMSEPDCCEGSTHDVTGKGCDVVGKDAACPHGGFCQEGASSSAVLAHHYITEAGAQSVPLSVLQQVTTEKYSRPFRPQQKIDSFPPPIFILHCSFLI